MNLLERIIYFLSDTKLKEHRYSICLSCKEFNEESKSCKICHCYLPVKVTLRASSCPLKKW